MSRLTAPGPSCVCGYGPISSVKLTFLNEVTGFCTNSLISGQIVGLTIKYYVQRGGAI